MSACMQCLVAGPACGPASGVADELAACVLCGTPTRARMPCGAARAYLCGGEAWHSGRVVRPGSDAPVTTCGTHPPDQLCRACTGREPREPRAARPALQWKAAAARRATAPQPKLSDELAERGLGPAEVRRGVERWNELFRGIEYRGEHSTTIGILNGTLKHSAIPELPPLDPAALAPLREGEAGVWPGRSWLVYGRHKPPEGPSSALWHLTGWDVHAMYLSAAAIELGTGAPADMSWPAEAVLDVPGFVQVSSLEGAPWSMGDRWSEGMWIPTPLAAYWRDQGAQFLIPRALVWPKHRRWLDPHVDLLRKARTALLADESEAGAALSKIVKKIYTRMFGGLLTSEDYNQGATLRPDWRWLIIGTAQARMFRNLDKMAGLVSTVVGVHADCAWIVMPAGYQQPPGLDVSDQAGKFHLTGRTPWTPQLREAWQDGRHKDLWHALAGEAGR